MSKVLKVVAVVASIAATIGSMGAFGGVALAIVSGVAAVATIGAALLQKRPEGSERQAQEISLSLGEQPRTVLFGEAVTGGGLLDAFNYGGKYGTDWEMLVVALADHECESLEGIYVNNDFVPYAADGDVAGYNGKLKLWWRPGTATQTLPGVVTTNGIGWTANDNLAGVCFAVVAYKSDQPDEENPTWPGGRPSFRYKLKGKKLYDPRKDSTVAGGSGLHRWNDPTTREWGNNAAVCRYNYQRGIYALEKVDEPDQLLLGRGLSEIEAPPERAMVWANLCDEDVALKSGGTEKRYTINGVIASDENFLDTEQKFAAAMGGIIMQPEGSIEVEPGHAKSVIADFTDDDILNLEAVTVEKFRSESDTEWCNMVVPRYVEPTQNWKMHGGPIRRVYADVLADGGLRQAPLSHELITSGTQSQRCAEIVRRMGRLFTTAQVTLPPRFIHIEEGDWVGWTSQRHFKGSRIVFRVERYNRNEKWHMALVLREINAGVFTFNPAVDELTDGAEATNQNEPPAVGQPGVSAWALSAGSVASANGTQPALVIEGAVDDDYASAVRFEYRKTADTEWVDAGSSARTATRKVIAPISPNTDYVVGVTYTVDGEASTRRIYGPVKTGNLAIDFGNITGTEELLQDLENALSLAAARGKVWTTPSAPATADSNVGDTWIAPDGVFYDRVPGGILLGGHVVVLDGFRPSIYWTRSANQPLESTIMMANDAALTAGQTATRIEAYDNDDILDISEKRRLILDDQNLEAAYQEIIVSATALAVDYTDLTTARTDYLAFRNGIAPAWNDTTQDSPVTRNSLDAVIVDYRSAFEKVRSDIEAAAKALADAAQSDADTASAAAAQANNVLADIASDGVLTPGEKPEVILKRDVILDEQAGITAEATSYGITTEKTDYTASITALTSYLATLTTPVLWSNLSGNTTIVGSTFRGKFADVYAARQVLLNKIDGVAARGLNNDGSVKDNKVSTPSITAGAVTGTTIVTASGASAAFSTIHELASVTVGSLVAGLAGIKFTGFGQINYTGLPTAGYPMIRVYRVPAANAAAYLASGSGTNRNPSTYGAVVGKNTTFSNWANIDMGAMLQHSVTSPVGGDIYVLAVDVATNPPSGGTWSYNWAAEAVIDYYKR